MAEAKAQKAARQKPQEQGPAYSETARRYSAPTLSNADRGESYSTNEPIEHHVDNAHFERINLPADDHKNAVALVSNLSGTETVGRMSGHPVDDAVNGILGLHIAPSNIPRLISDVTPASSRSTQAAANLKPLLDAATKAQKDGKSLILVSDHQFLDPDTRANVLHEELNHAVQRAATGTLAGHLKTRAAAFVNDPLIAPLVQRLRNAGCQLKRGVDDGKAAAEIGEKLMRAGAAEQELGLTSTQAHTIASKYVQTLRRVYGKAADPIIERINDALGLQLR